MLGASCSPCCTPPELLSFFRSNLLHTRLSATRSAGGAVFNFGLCGTYNVVTGAGGVGTQAVDCRDETCDFANLNLAPYDSPSAQSYTGSLSCSAVLKVPANTPVTVTLSGTVPSVCYVFAGVNGIDEAAARNLSSDVQWSNEFTGQLTWSPMPSVMNSPFDDLWYWSTRELFTWPCNTIGSVLPLHSVNSLSTFTGGGCEIFKGTQLTSTGGGPTVCYVDNSLSIARTCCDAVSASSSTVHEITHPYCRFYLYFRKFNHFSRAHAFTCSLSWPMPDDE